MIGQGPTRTHSSPPPPHSNLPNLVGDSNVDMLACSPFDSIVSPAPSNAADPRRPSIKAPHPSEVLKCPRCDSLDTKFCYYNNYSLTQPRYFCKNCKRYWTAGGALRNVPVGGGLRKNKRSKLKLAADAEAALAAQALATGVQQHQKVDNSTTVPANAVTPSHLAVGMPELGMYPHPNRGTTTPRYGEQMPDQNSGALVIQQEVELYRKGDKNAGMNYFVRPSHVPQFYSSHAASVPVQFGNPISGEATTGYAMNYNFLPPKAHSNVEVTNEKHNQTMQETDGSAVPPSRGEENLDKLAETARNSYEWQLISEGLFNSGGATDGNFFYMPSSSWPDFSQFNDCGPG